MQIRHRSYVEVVRLFFRHLAHAGQTSHRQRQQECNSAIANSLADRFPGITVASDNQEVLDHSDTIVVAVRPSVARDVLSELRFRPDHQVTSLVSGLSLLSLSELVAPAPRVASAVPLPSTANRLSPTAIYPPDPMAFELFAAVGTVFPVERENEFDAICATTATIAFYLAFSETIASWLEQRGVPQSVADYQSWQNFSGSELVVILLLTLREAMLRANVFDFEVPGRFAEPPAMPGEESFPTRNTSRLTRSPPVTSRCSKANTLKQSNIPRTYKTLMSTQNSS